jgi:hypothetical protein
MKKLTSLFTIICCASALTACTEDHLYYETSHSAYNSTQTVAPSSYYGTAQTPPPPSVGSTTYYTGVPANNPPASGYNSTQTPSAPPAGYSNNQQQVPGNGYRGNNPGYYANPVNVAQPANNAPARANTMNDEFAASRAAVPAKVVPAASTEYPTSSNVIPVGKLTAIHKDTPHQLAPASPIVKTDKTVALAPDIR